MSAGGKYLLIKDNNAFLHCMDVENRDCGDMKAKDMSHLLLLGKFEYSGGPIFKVVLEC